jgi:PAS domain S-box-containing protein
MDKVKIFSPEDFFSAAVLSSPDCITVTRLEDGQYIEVNGAFLAMTGFERDEVIGKTSKELFLWAESEGRERFLSSLAREGRIRDENILLRVKGGEIRSFQASAAIVMIGGIECVVKILRDVTAQSEMVNSLEKSHFLLERAEEMANIGIWEFDYRSGKVSASQGACRIYGVEKGELSVRDIESVPLPEYRAIMNGARDALIKEGAPYDIEFKIERRNDRAIRVIHSKAKWDPANKRLFGIIRDITEEKETAAGLKRAIAEKEILLKELYHRTKNNMQVISSLLGIEGASIIDERTRDIFDMAQRRIDSMALVHEMLYQSEDLSRINLKDFIPSLAELLKSSLGDHEGRIAFSYEVENVELLIDAAVPCGIILNELVTNALVHAFPGRRSGTITLKARREGKTVVIEVRDDGAGVPESFDYRGMAEKLGLTLVSSIGRFQLRGSVDFEAGEGGFGCTLKFPDSPREAPA